MIPRIYNFGVSEIRKNWVDFDGTYARLFRVTRYIEDKYDEGFAELLVAYLSLFETIRVNTTNRGKTEIRVSERFLVLLEYEEKKLEG